MKGGGEGGGAKGRRGGLDGSLRLHLVTEWIIFRCRLPAGSQDSNPIKGDRSYKADGSRC